MPTDLQRQLETLLARIRNAGSIQLNYDMWDRHGAAHASAEERATMGSGFAEANRDQAQAKTALTALVATMRDSAPSELASWVQAHDAYLAGFLEDSSNAPDRTAVFVATNERKEWAEVLAGTRAFVDENAFYVTLNRERYRRLFGIDPTTLEPC